MFEVCLYDCFYTFIWYMDCNGVAGKVKTRSQTTKSEGPLAGVMWMQLYDCFGRPWCLHVLQF